MMSLRSRLKLCTIRSEASEAWPADKPRIHQAIRAGPGHEAIDRALVGRFHGWMDDAGCRALERADPATDAALAASVARLLKSHGKPLAAKGVAKAAVLEAMLAGDAAAYSMHSLASVMHDLGDVHGALRMMKRAHDRFSRALGDTHCDTLSCSVDLAALMRDVGDAESLAAAERLLRDAAGVLSAQLAAASTAAGAGSAAGAGDGVGDGAGGLERRDTELLLLLLSCKLELAHVLVELEKLPGAVELMQDTVAGRERLLHPDHPATLAARASLGEVYLQLGRLTQAREQLESAVDDLRRVTAGGDFRLFTAINSLGAVHQEMAAHQHGRRDAAGEIAHLKVAQALYREAMHGRTTLLGARHPATVRTAFNLATALNDLGEEDDARAFYRQALAGFEQLRQYPLAARCKECLNKLPPE